MTKGEGEQLIATVLPDNATDPSVTWTSNKTEVATVDQNGNVTSVAPGKATITAKAGDIAATCTVTVVTLEVDKFIPMSGVLVGKLNIENPQDYTVKLIGKTLNDVLDSTNPDADGRVNLVFIGMTDILNLYGYRVTDSKNTIIIKGDLEPEH